MDASVISVSVALATCNGRKYIRRQLDSIAAQTKIPAELVVTDDKSEDETVSIIDAFARTASFPVNIYRNETRLGYRANFMRAASLCRSELIGFCDQDDYWYPHKIAMLVEPFSDPEVLLAYHNANVMTGEGEHIGTLADRASPQSVMMPMSSNPFWPFALGFTQVFRRSLLQLNDLWPKSHDQYDLSQPLAHDQWFFFLAAAFGRVAYIDEPLAAYMQHEGNTYGWRKPSNRVKKHFRDRSAEYAYYAKAAESRANILEIAKSKLEGVWVERAAAATEFYRKVSWLLTERNTVYSSAKLSDRLRAFSTVLGKGGYTGASGLGGKSLVADFCFGVIISHFLRSAPAKNNHDLPRSL
jgi:glycosyltransferase involved in cell wall biosynthesis